MRSVLITLVLVLLTPFTSAQRQRATFADFASVVSQSVERVEPYRPCGDGLSGHCVCREVTWICGGEIHSVTYELCSMCDVEALRDILHTAAAMGCTLVSIKAQACH